MRTDTNGRSGVLEITQTCTMATEVLEGQVGLDDIKIRGTWTSENEVTMIWRVKWQVLLVYYWSQAYFGIRE